MAKKKMSDTEKVEYLKSVLYDVQMDILGVTVDGPFDDETENWMSCWANHAATVIAEALKKVTNGA